MRPIIDSAGAGKPLAAFIAPEAPAGAGGAEPRRRAEFPHAGGLRRRDRGRAVAAPAAADRNRADRRAHGRRSERPRPRRARGRRAARPARHRARAVGRARRRHHAGAAPALSLSGRGQGAVRRDRAQDRRRRRRARRRRRRGADRRDPQDRAPMSPHESLARASRACWCSRWSTGLGEVLVGYRVDRDVGPLVMVAAGGLLHRDRARPQPAARAGRSRRRRAR